MRFTSDYTQDITDTKGRVFTLLSNANQQLCFVIADKSNANLNVVTDVTISLNTWYFFTVSVSYLTGFNIFIFNFKNYV